MILENLNKVERRIVHRWATAAAGAVSSNTQNIVRDYFI